MKSKGKEFILLSAASVCMVLYGAVNVLLAFCLKNIVDAATAQELTAFSHAVGLTVAIAVFELGIGILSRFLLQSYCKYQLVAAKSNYFRKTLCAGKSDQNDVSAFSTDIDVLYTNYYMNKGLIVYGFAQLIFSTVSIVYLSWKISVVVLLFTFLPLFSPLLFRKKLQQETGRYTEASGNYLSFVQDSMNGLQEIQTYRAFDFFAMHHDKLNKKTESCRLKNKMWLNCNNRVASFLGTLSFIVTIAICGYFTIRGETTIGTLIAVIQLLNSVVGPIGTISGEIGEMNSAKKIVQKYAECECTENEAETEKYVSRIDIDHVGFSYDSQQQVLKNLNMKLEHGKRYAVIGESGTGKSTYAKILAGMLECSEGSITYIDNSGQPISSAQIAEHVQYVAQEPYVFKLTAEDNVYFGKPESERQMRLRMEKLGISGIFENRLHVISNRDQISGGQKQRLVIARALSHKPDILVLDEPTANLDPKTASSIMEYILAEDYGMLIVITHDTSEKMLSMFDEVIHIGQII